MAAYLILGMLAVLAFLCVSQAIPHMVQQQSAPKPVASAPEKRGAPDVKSLSSRPKQRELAA